MWECDRSSECTGPEELFVLEECQSKIGALVAKDRKN